MKSRGEETRWKPMVKVYFDTSVWIAPFDRWRTKEQVDAIKALVTAFRAGSILLCSSRKVEEELQNIVTSKPEKMERARQAFHWLKSVNPHDLGFRPAIYDQAIYDEAYYDQGYEFDKLDLRNQDWAVAEFLTANDVQYFVSVDEDFLRRVEPLLKAKGHDAVLPEVLVKILAP